MSDRNEHWVLNRLIEMCRDEEQTLRYLADRIKGPVARTLLADLAERRARFAADLVPHAQRLGGFRAQDGTSRGVWHRRWMAVRDAIVRLDDRARIEEAEQEERRVLDMYGGALDSLLPPETRDLVEHQLEETRRAHDQVQALLTH